MKQTFTRWPGDPMALPDVDLVDGRPRWARTAGTPPPRKRRIGALSVALLPLLPIPLLPLFLAGPLLPAALFLLVAASAVAVALIWRRADRLEQRLSADERWTALLFEQAGISLWREDWRAARDKVLALLESGITDMERHFAEHPQSLRDLRKQVIIKDVNRYAVEMMGAAGKADLVGPLDRILPDTDQTFLQWLVAFAGGDRYYRSETHIVRADGSEIDVLFTARIPSDAEGFNDIVVSALDISGLKAAQQRLSELERDLLRTSRITTMGALSASIAHEVNSPLAAIISSAEASLRWLERTPPDYAEASAAVAAVIADARRAHAVVQRTRAWIGNATRGPGPVDLAQVARNAILLVERELRANDVSLLFDCDAALPAVSGDEIQLQQVMVNLLMNGAQAMENKPTPRDLRLTIRGSAADVVLTVADSGPGIEPDRLPRIFEPFYSGREGGMGLGLAICRTVVESHGGRIWVTSEAGAGARFHLRLPAADSGDLATGV